MEKRLALSLGLILLMGVGVFAIWQFSHTANTGLVVTSTGNGLSFTDNFTTTNIDTTSAMYNKTESIVIINSDGATPLSVAMATNIVDVADGCNNTGDINVSANYNGQPVQNGSNISVISGQSFFNVTTTAKIFSCPQSVNTQVNLTN